MLKLHILPFLRGYNSQSWYLRGLKKIGVVLYVDDITSTKNHDCEAYINKAVDVWKQGSVKSAKNAVFGWFLMSRNSKSIKCFALKFCMSV